VPEDEFPEFDTSVAHPARIYDYWLGGKDNFAADRAAGDRVIEIRPEIIVGVRANRRFLRRAVRYLVEHEGIRQFLDIGTGLPSANNTHEVAQALAPDARVVYADNDPIVAAHARALLTSAPEGRTAFISADLRDAARVAGEAAQTLDFGRPVAVMFLMTLQYVPDADDPHAIVARVMDAVPSGSYLAVSHVGADLLPAATQEEMNGIASRVSQQQYTPRSREQVSAFFTGMDLVEPGLVRVGEWRAEPGSTSQSFVWAAVGRKR
jgi:hypothetical protein